MESHPQFERSLPSRRLENTLLFVAGIGISAAVNLVTALESRHVAPLRWVSIGLFAACTLCLFVASSKSEKAHFRLLLRQSSDPKDFGDEFSGFVGGRSWAWLGCVLGLAAALAFYLSLPLSVPEAGSSDNGKEKLAPSPTATTSPKP